MDGLGTPVQDWFSTHEMFFTEASWPIRNMDGTPVGTTDPLQVRRMEVNGRKGWAATAGQDRWVREDPRSQAVRLHHYVQRSHAECMAKERRMALLALRDSTRLDFTWRATAGVCAVQVRKTIRDPSRPDLRLFKSTNFSLLNPTAEAEDHSLSRFGPVIRKEISRLFLNGLQATFRELDETISALTLAGSDGGHGVRDHDGPFDPALESYLSRQLCYAQHSASARKLFCYGGMEACNWAKVAAHWAEAESGKLASCHKARVLSVRSQPTNSSKAPKPVPTSLIRFGRLLRCIAQSNMHWLKLACNCTLSTCKWPHLAKVVEHPDVLQVSKCALFRSKPESQAQRKERLAKEGVSPLGTNATPTATCFDAWAVKYPAEVNERSKRSCKWKLEWNQCDQYGDYCKLTCGKCTGGTRAVLTAKPHPQPAQAREGG